MAARWPIFSRIGGLFAAVVAMVRLACSRERPIDDDLEDDFKMPPIADGGR
jgi:hypothetical protein